jgi:hypothetical protein
MNQNVVNPAPYLRTSREFPFHDVKELAFEINKAYVDIANDVNNRVIGIFPVTRPAITGESWFLKGNQKQQTFRQVYNISANAGAPVNTDHMINLNSISAISRSFGSFTDGTNWYGLIFGGFAGAVGQIVYAIDVSQIVFFKDAGSPNFVSGFVVIEWLSNV